jgi:hypothetical protein
MPRWAATGFVDQFRRKGEAAMAHVDQATPHHPTASIPAGVDLAIRVAIWLFALLSFVLAYALFTKASWATALWPWPEPGMSFIFLASIAAAIGAAWLWIAVTGEYAALAGIGLNALVVNAGVAIFLATRVVGSGEQWLLPGIGLGVVFALFGAAVYWWSRRLPLRDPRPMPRIVWVSFIGFVVTLTVVGSALVLQLPRIFPWDLRPPTSTLFGLIFLGAATYFVLGATRAQWVFAAGPLWSFLAYDLVLFVPYSRLLVQKVTGAGGSFDDIGYGGSINEGSLVIYLAVLTYSTLLALYALFIHPDTRIIRPRPPAAPA